MLLVLALTGCAKEVEEAASCCLVRIEAVVPEGTGTLYLSGNVAALGPWRPDTFAMAEVNGVRVAELTLPPGTDLEYKFTLGNWDREALGPSGTVMPNFRLAVEGSETVRHELDRFKSDPVALMDDWRSSGVQGTLEYWRDVPSVHLTDDRHVVIWLPPGFDEAEDRRYPVLYMHDGQNLFDPRMGGSDGNVWAVDDAIVRLTEKGLMEPVIVVGVFNTPNRISEYSPWHGARDYASFLIEELMPRVNATYPTRTGPESTYVMGSSMGGLLSYFLVKEHPDVFGACGCISSHFPFSPENFEAFTGRSGATGQADSKPYILRDIEAGLDIPAGVRFWFDYGDQGLDAGYAATHQALREALLAEGLVEGVDFVVRAYPGDDHNEASWRDRLEDPLSFLYGAD
jgi:enterochelin esterase-like enzyme